MKWGLRCSERDFNDSGRRVSAEAGAAEEARAVSGLAGAFAGLYIEAAALSGPDSSRPVLGDFEDLLFAALEVETARIGVAWPAVPRRPGQIVSLQLFTRMS